MTTPTPAPGTTTRTWHCLTCPGHPEFTQAQMREHLPVHELSGRTPAHKHMQTHLDCETEAFSIYIWTFENGVQFQETIVERRTVAGLRQWQPGRAR